MNPAMIALILSLVEEAIKVYPTLSADLAAIFSKPNPTPADWFILRSKVQAMKFEEIAPDVKLN
ncbi:MAG: hypothetical protein WCJ07_14240 [Verrucomicrobiota bacterium]